MFLSMPQYKRQEDVLSVSLIICPDGLFIVARVLLQELDILVSELLLDTADPHGRAAELWLNISCAELATKVQDDFTIMDMEKTLHIMLNVHLNIISRHEIKLGCRRKGHKRQAVFHIIDYSRQLHWLCDL